MNRILQRLKEIPISLKTIEEYCPDNVRVLLYDRIPSSKQQFFGGKDAVIIFYEMHDATGQAKNTTGHFSLVVNGTRPKYWSSYGFPPEKEISLTHSKGKLLRILGQHDWNKTRYQKIKHTNTCGLHVLARSYLLDFTEDQYRKLMMRRVVLQSADLIVCIMCLILVRKELQ